jgi:hypothetical protein
MLSIRGKSLSPTTASLLFAAAVALLGIGSATAVRWKLHLDSDLSVTPVTTQTSPSAVKPEQPPQTIEEPKASERERFSKVYVGGIWKYDLNGSRTLIKQVGENIEFYVDDPEQGQTRVGRGVVTEDGVRATLDVRSKRRSANINLRLSKDGRRLEGWFMGVDPEEGGHVALTKIG